MAQDIIITPRSGEPSIAFTGSGTTASSISLKVLSDSTLSFEGTQGQLFSITDNLTSGVIFGVNDIGGLPLIEASANGNVSLVRYGNNVGIGTGSPAAKLDILETWNTSAVQTGIKLNVIDASSAATSKLMELQTSGQTRFSFQKDGNLTIISGTSQSPTFRLQGSDRNGDIRLASNAVGVALAGIELQRTNSTLRFLNANGTIIYGQIVGDSEHVLAQLNGTNAQSYRIYNTYTDVSNYERAGLNWNASAFQIQTEASGTGLARNLIIGTSSIPRITIASTGELTFNSSSIARLTNVHGQTQIHNYAGGYPSTPDNTLGNSSRFIAYQGTNSNIRPVLELKDYRNTHWNNLGAGMRSAGLSFVFENGNNAGTPIAEKTIGAIYTVQDSASRMDSAALVFASNGTTEKMRISSGGNIGIGLTSPLYRLHVAASSYPVLYASGTTTDASAQFTFETNGKLRIGATDGTFGEKIRFNNGYGIETFSGGGIRIRGGAYVTIADAVPFDGANFSPGYFGYPSLSLRSKFETQCLLELQQQSWNTQTDDYFRIIQLQSGFTKRIFTIASSGWVGVGLSSPATNLHVSGNALITSSVSALNYYNTSGLLPTTLQQLYDVSSTALPAEGYILIYTGGKWVALPPVIDGGSA
jgi:hypothetical protein